MHAASHTVCISNNLHICFLPTAMDDRTYEYCMLGIVTTVKKSGGLDYLPLTVFKKKVILVKAPFPCPGCVEHGISNHIFKNQ